MEDVMERPRSLWGHVTGWFGRGEEEEHTYEEYPDEPVMPKLRVHSNERSHITIRRHIVSYGDAVAAAEGLKSGQQQIMNLSGTPPELRQKIIDFMCGVNFYADGEWEELGENVYLLAPSSAYVEVASSAPRARSMAR